MKKASDKFHAIMKTKNQYIFVILSNQPFYSDLKTNKWHTANVLSDHGYKVVFIDPPLRFRALKRFLKKPSIHLSRLFYNAKRENNNLMVYMPANLFNFWPFSLLNTYMHSNKIERLVEEFKEDMISSDDLPSDKTKNETPSTDLKGKGNVKVVMWVYHFDFPDLRKFLEKMNYDILIYDCVDEYTAFPEYAEGKKINKGIISWIQRFDDKLKVKLNQKNLKGVNWVLAQEEWLSKSADIVFASAPGLVDKLKQWTSAVFYTPNAAKVEKFDFDRYSLPEPDDLKTIKHPRIGFTGAIDAYKNNIELIEKVASAYQEYNFVLVGPERLSDPDLDLSKLKKMKNVYFLGQKPWQETPNYFNNFDVYFIPYNLNEYTIKGCFPVKYFEALATGLPTVVTNMPAYFDYDVDGYVSKNDEEFIENIKKALDEDSSERIKKRKALARQNSYNGKVAKQLKVIDEYIDGD